MNTNTSGVIQIVFDDNSLLSSLFGIADRNIHLLEKLNNVIINYKGNVVKIMGKKNSIEETKLTLQKLFEDAKKGHEIDDEKIRDTKSFLKLSIDKQNPRGWLDVSMTEEIVKLHKTLIAVIKDLFCNNCDYKDLAEDDSYEFTEDSKL